jgi:hypothetical protein
MSRIPIDAGTGANVSSAGKAVATRHRLARGGCA